MALAMHVAYLNVIQQYMIDRWLSDRNIVAIYFLMFYKFKQTLFTNSLGNPRWDFFFLFICIAFLVQHWWMLFVGEPVLDFRWNSRHGLFMILKPVFKDLTTIGHIYTGEKRFHNSLWSVVDKNLCNHAFELQTLFILC